ncbi:MAG: efflux RND transporter periplasmic adaptor subunit [Deltaproteobacteria bacterium]|nr:efflux RND transporter periplasmic adaptor subunit [Myxococcales bacterium]MDP3212980.1 efflux RND transporter periplasmic adaptor subunit [Deltaproteobacteria bacterium]
MGDQLSDDLASLRIDRDDPPPASARARRAPTNPSGGGSGIVRYAFVALLLGGVAFGAVRAWPHLESRLFKTEVQTGEIVSASPAQGATTVTATGYVIALTSARVSSRVPGRVAAVRVREGDVVRAGQVMLELDATDVRSTIAAARARVAAASARVAIARANLADGRQQLERQRRLAESGAVSRQVVEDLQARLSPLEASVAAAAAEVRALQADVNVQSATLSLLTIRAPFDGTVVNRPPRPGELLGSELMAGSIIELADFASMVAEVDVPEGRLGLVRVGGPCEVALDAFPGRRFRATVQETGHRVDRSKATVAVRVRFVDPMEGVLPDMAARVSFLTQPLTPEMLRAAQRTLVPAAAVTTRNGARAVLVLDNNTVHVRPVNLGPMSGDAYELIEGPPPGTRVVLRPPATLGEANPVREANR